MRYCVQRNPLISIDIPSHLAVSQLPNRGVTVMPLTDIQVRNAKPGDKQVKMTDGGGLYLLVTPKGGRWWRFDYRFGGKRKTLSLGTYPDVSLKDARDRRVEVRKLVSNGAPSMFDEAIGPRNIKIFYILSPDGSLDI